MDDGTSFLQATCIALDGRAGLLLGPPGSGKSDLALRCITTPLVLDGRTRQAGLVADDGVLIERHGGRLRVRPPEAIRGRLEVRGLGIIEIPHVPEADLTLIVRLAAPKDIERLPDPWPHEDLLGVRLPVLLLAAFEASAPYKLLLALAGAGQCPSGS